MTLASDVATPEKSVPKNASAPSISATKGVVTVTTTKDKTTAGTYVYEITYGTLKTNLVVTVAKPSGNTTYKANIDVSTLDTTITTTTATNATIQAVVTAAKYEGGVKSAEVSLASISVVNSKGVAVTTAAIEDAKMINAAATTGAISASSITIIAAKYDNSTKTFTKLLPADTYTITLKFWDAEKKNTITQTLYLTVKDEQGGVTVTQLSRNFTGKIADAVTSSAVVTYTYGGKDVTGSAIKFASSTTTSEGLVHSNIVVDVTVDIDTNRKVVIPVTLPESITVTEKTSP
jgi:hypothetical protein